MVTNLLKIALIRLYNFVLNQVDMRNVINLFVYLIKIDISNQWVY